MYQIIEPTGSTENQNDLQSLWKQAIGIGTTYAGAQLEKLLKPGGQTDDASLKLATQPVGVAAPIAEPLTKRAWFIPACIAAGVAAVALIAYLVSGKKKK